MSGTKKDIRNALPANVKLKNYQLKNAINNGGFGIVYLARCLKTRKKVVIKEYLPNNIGVRAKNGHTVQSKSAENKEHYKWGLKSFIEEAQTVSKFRDHPNIVTILDFFTANNTAYIVMEFAGSYDLSQYLAKKKTLTEAQVKALFLPLLDALETIHSIGFVHRDIKPGNILISDTGEPILLDFGATRQSVGAVSMDLTQIVSRGYAPWEQYQSRSKQGPWTDIYALAATFYTCVVGKRPVDATDRVGGARLTPALEQCEGKYSEELLRMIDWGMIVDQTQRPQTIAEWETILEGAEPPEPNPIDPPSKENTFNVSTLKEITPMWFHIPYWFGVITFVSSLAIANDLIKASLVSIGLVSVVIGYIYQYVALFRAWKSIQYLQDVPSAGKAVGFMFIPFFSLYWGFIAYSKLAEKMNTIIEKQRLKIQPINYGWSIALPVILLISILSFVIPNLELLGLWLLPMQGVILSYLIHSWSVFIKDMKLLKYITR